MLSQTPFPAWCWNLHPPGLPGGIVWSARGRTACRPWPIGAQHGVTWPGIVLWLVTWPGTGAGTRARSPPAARRGGCGTRAGSCCRCTRRGTPAGPRPGCSTACIFHRLVIRYIKAAVEQCTYYLFFINVLIGPILHTWPYEVHICVLIFPVL